MSSGAGESERRSYKNKKNFNGQERGKTEGARMKTRARKTTGYFPTGLGVSRVQAAEDRATDSSINMALGVEGRFSGRPGRVRNCILTSLVGRTRAPHYDPFGAALEKLQGMYYMAICGCMRSSLRSATEVQEASYVGGSLAHKQEQRDDRWLREPGAVPFCTGRGGVTVSPEGLTEDSLLVQW